MVSLLFSDYLLSAALMIPTYLMVFLLGMLISMIFYRLPKPWKIVVAIGFAGIMLYRYPLCRQLCLWRLVDNRYCLSSPVIGKISAPPVLKLCRCCTGLLRNLWHLFWLLFRKAPINNRAKMMVTPFLIEERSTFFQSMGDSLDWKDLSADEIVRSGHERYSCWGYYPFP